MKLTQREQELYELITVHGLNLKEAAKVMVVSYATAKMHLKHIYLKKQCSSQIELVRLYYEDKLNDKKIN